MLFILDVKTKATATSNTATSTTVQAAAAADGNGPVSSLPVGEALRKLDSIRGDVAGIYRLPTVTVLKFVALLVFCLDDATLSSCTHPLHHVRVCILHTSWWHGTDVNTAISGQCRRVAASFSKL